MGTGTGMGSTLSGSGGCHPYGDRDVDKDSLYGDRIIPPWRGMGKAVFLWGQGYFFQDGDRDKDGDEDRNGYFGDKDGKKGIAL